MKSNFLSLSILQYAFSVLYHFFVSSACSIGVPLDSELDKLIITLGVISILRYSVLKDDRLKIDYSLLAS